jgi:hypothetical protein
MLALNLEVAPVLDARGVHTILHTILDDPRRENPGQAWYFDVRGCPASVVLMCGAARGKGELWSRMIRSEKRRTGFAHPRSRRGASGIREA